MPERIKNLSSVNLRQQLGPVVLGEVEYRPGGEVGPRVQHDYQLVLMLSGEVELHQDRGIVPIRTGQAVLLSPRHREHFLFARDVPTHHYWCAIAPAGVPAPLRRLFRASRGPVAYSARLRQLWEITRAAARSGDRRSALDDARILHLALALLCDFAAAVSEREIIRTPALIALEKAEAFVSREYAQPIALPEIARAAGVSRQHLLKLCRQQARPTPTEFLSAHRLDRARDLLAHTGLAVGEVSERCGFQNPFHFSRKFSQRFHLSPRDYRKKVWQAD